jgi:AcrR family transcriptional regulator
LPLGEDTKERIERTALRLFVEQGISETSIREIAQMAGVSQGAMYNHYVSKDELAWTLFVTNFSEIGSNLRDLAREQDTLEAKFRAMIRYAFELFDTDWVLVTYVFFARYHHLKKLTPDIHNPYMVFRMVIAEAMKRGEIPRRDLEVAASMVLGSIVQVTDTKVLGRIKQDLSELADSVAAACVRMLKE